MPKKSETDVAEDQIDLTQVPGFHVVRGDGILLGTYQTREDAECFIEQQVAPQDIEASIVEGVTEE